MSHDVAILALSVRPRVVLRFTGQLCAALAGMTAVGLLVTAALGEWGYAWRFGVLTALLGAVGALSARLPTVRRLQTNEALVITALGFGIGAVALAWPLTASGLDWLDALFEGVSAITTTGLSTQAAVEGFGPAFHFTRAWGQWFGGLGIVVLALAVLIDAGPVARRLSLSDEGPENTAASTRAWAARFTLIYGLLTLAGVVLLLATGVGPWDALLHTLAAISTGGFSSYDDSLAGLGGWVPQAAVMAICVTGAISFAVYHRTWRRGWRVLVGDVEVRTLLILAGLAALLVGVLMALAGHAAGTAIPGHALLLAFSAQTTAGFSPLPVAPLDAASKIVLSLSMLIGGDIGSSAGGIKIVRFLILLKLLHFTIVRTCLPAHASVRLRLGGRRLDERAVGFAGATALWYVVIALGIWLAFAAAGFDATDAFFEVASAMGTVGLSTGVSAAVESGWLKGLLALAMLLGRLEIFAVLVLFYPRTWIGRRALER